MTQFALYFSSSSPSWLRLITAASAPARAGDLKMTRRDLGVWAGDGDGEGLPGDCDDDSDSPAEMKVLQGWAPAFTAFHHKLNVYTALLSRLRPQQTWASGWGYFAIKSHTDSNPRQRYLSPRLCRDFSPPLLGLNYFNTDLLSEDIVILDLLPDLITCVRSSLFPINHFE